MEMTQKDRACCVLPCCNGKHKGMRGGSDRSHWVTCTIWLNILRCQLQSNLACVVEDDSRAKHIPLPAPPSGCAPHTEQPTDVPLPHNNWPTSAVWAAAAYCLDCSIAASLHTPRQPLLHCLHTLCVPPLLTPDLTGFLCLSHTSATLNQDLQTLQGHDGGCLERGGGDAQKKDLLL